MRNRILTSMAVLVLTIVPAAARAPKAKTAPVKRAWTPPPTPDGQPSFREYGHRYALQRPKELAGKEYYTEAELAEFRGY